jgi:hypothetical protein
VVDKYKYKQPLLPERLKEAESLRLYNILSDKGHLNSFIPNYLDDVAGCQINVRVRAVRFDIRKGYYNFTG